MEKQAKCTLHTVRGIIDVLSVGVFMVAIVQSVVMDGKLIPSFVKKDKVLWLALLATVYLPAFKRVFGGKHTPA